MRCDIISFLKFKRDFFMKVSYGATLAALAVSQVVKFHGNLEKPSTLNVITDCAGIALSALTLFQSTKSAPIAGTFAVVNLIALAGKLKKLEGVFKDNNGFFEKCWLVNLFGPPAVLAFAGLKALPPLSDNFKFIVLI